MRDGWLKVLLLVLVLEKIIQHIFVTLAFYFDWAQIRSTVAVNADALMVLGGMAAILFAVSLAGLWKGKPWAPGLVMGLAIFDIVGEFAAQGTFFIVLNVSFLVAWSLLILAIAYQRKKQ